MHEKEKEEDSILIKLSVDYLLRVTHLPQVLFPSPHKPISNGLAIKQSWENKQDKINKMRQQKVWDVHISIFQRFSCLSEKWLRIYLIWI